MRLGPAEIVIICLICTFLLSILASAAFVIWFLLKKGDQDKDRPA